MFQLTIVGLGPAGIFALAMLPDTILSNTLVLEPAAIGGALSTHYATVVANLTKKVICEAIHNVPRWADLSLPFLDSYTDDQCPILGDVMKQLRALVAPLLPRVHFHAQTLTRLVKSDAKWIIHTQSNLFETKAVIACTGATPKTLDLPVPHIPLHIALSKSALASFISPTDTVVVFGTSHSGTLILKNLKDLGCTRVSAIYKSEKPFYFAREGFTEGLKQESAAIADDILNTVWGAGTPTLVPYSDFASVFRCIHSAQAVVYAVGFQTGELKYETGATAVGALSDTSQLIDAATKTPIAGLWGFGIGFPSTYIGTNDTKYPDVGFGPFVDAIKKALPAILAFVA